MRFDNRSFWDESLLNDSSKPLRTLEIKLSLLGIRGPIGVGEARIKVVPILHIENRDTIIKKPRVFNISTYGFPQIIKKFRVDDITFEFTWNTSLRLNKRAFDINIIKCDIREFRTNYNIVFS